MLCRQCQESFVYAPGFEPYCSRLCRQLALRLRVIARAPLGSHQEAARLAAVARGEDA